MTALVAIPASVVGILETQSIGAVWPKLQPIQTELPLVMDFAEELLPESLRAFVKDAAGRMQVPLDFSGVAVILGLAGVVGRRASIQPKANDTSWVVVPNLWGGIIAPPGYMKSPIIQSVTRILNQIQAEWRFQDEEAMAAYNAAAEEYELKYSAWKEKYKASAKQSGPELPERPDNKPEKPTYRRLIANDATFEKLHQIMSENDAGVLVTRDELTGWLSQLSRSGREGERAFCLQAWNGDTPRVIDRIQRGTVAVEACCMSLMGGIQPSRLRSFFGDAFKDGDSSDGLIQRFQVLCWPDLDPRYQYVDRCPNADCEASVGMVFRALVNLDAKNPLRFRFDTEAQALFEAWLTALELTVRSDEMHPALISHLSKYRSLMPSIALLFELADRVRRDGSILGAVAPVVGLQQARRAAEFCDYLESHARRIYSCVVAPQIRAANLLADKVRRRSIAIDGFFTVREIYLLKGWSGLDTPEAVRHAVEILQDAGSASTERVATDRRPPVRAL
jgi:putative DNA primase/helicase